MIMEPLIPPARQNKPNHNKRETIVLVILLILLLIGVGFGLYTALRQEPISFQERAQTIQTLSCPANGATCSWSAVSGVTSYSFTILDQTTGTTVKTGTVQDTKITFTPLLGHAYQCTVKALNQCGEGSSRSAVNTCVGLGTPRPTQVPSETPTPSVEVTPTPTVKITPTVTIPTQTPTPIPTREITPTRVVQTPVPTVEIIVSSSPTPTGSLIVQQITQTPTSIPSATPRPQPPVSGSNTGVLFMVVSSVILVSLMLVF